MRKIILVLLLNFLFLDAGYPNVRLKSLARISGLQENMLTGYGLVIGLAGSGDSRRNKDTMQAISNLLLSFGVNIPPHEVNSRNTATVIVTAHLPPFSHQGDKIDVNVASLGDARSLLGGTLLITPLKGPDNKIYALAQGPVSIGGFKYDLFGNVVQKNHPTAGLIPGGAVVERSLYNDLIDKRGVFHLILNHPDFSTADTIERLVNEKFGGKVATARSAQDIEIHPPKEYFSHLIRFVSQLEKISLTPDSIPMVVVNEKTGVIVAGADVKLDAVTISHGDIQIAISTEYNVSQPELVSNVSRRVQTTVTPSTSIQVQENTANAVQLRQGATIADLIAALNQVHTSTRDIIAILESLKRAGALHAELVIQ